MKIKRPLSKRPIPKNAKQVFKGKIFDVYQWQQELFDGSLATFEKIKRSDTVNVIPVTKEKKIILAEQEQPGEEPFIGTLGGRIDKGEMPLEAAKRELLEETGYKADKYLLWDAAQIFPKVDWAVYTFIAKGCAKVGEMKLEAGERIKLRLVSFDEFLEIIFQENFRDFEIAIKIFRMMKDKRKLEETRKLFLG